jgi:Flp pilus assembly protein TadB
LNLFRRKPRTPQPQKKTLERERREFASALSLMKHRAIAIGLHATGERLDPAIRMAGFELAGDIEACLRYEKTQGGI